jgi:hypothetical protein
MNSKFLHQNVFISKNESTSIQSHVNGACSDDDPGDVTKLVLMVILVLSLSLY